MTDQAQAVDVEERLAQFLEAEEVDDSTAADEAVTEEPVETDSEDEAHAEDEQETATEEEPTEVIIHNGEEKQLSKTELKELAQKGFDYTQKTQQLAERARYLEQQEQAIQQQAQIQAQFTDQIAQAKALQSQLEQWKGVNWTELAQTDPMQYLSLHHQYTEAKDAYQTQLQNLNHLQQQAHETVAQQKAQRATTEAQAMRQAIPEWKDAARAQAEWNEIDAWLVKSGYPPGTVNAIEDHKQIVAARKAMLYDKLMATGQKKVQATPPTAKPGSTAKPTKQAADKQLRTQLKNSGRVEDAAKLIERML